VVTEGRGVLRLDGQDEPLRPGTRLLASAEVDHLDCPQREALVTIIWCQEGA
jgi:hypothetical protein